MRFNSYKVLLKFITERGYEPQFLLKNIKEKAPDPKKQTEIDWYPYQHYRIFGYFDSKSIMYLTLFLTQNSSHPKISKEMCLWSPFISSFRECMLYLCKYIHKSNIEQVLLPFGGIPFYIPLKVGVTVLDNDESIESDLRVRPKCEYILNNNLNIFQLHYNVKTIVCINLTQYIRNYEYFEVCMNLFHGWLESNGILILNLVINIDDEDYDEAFGYHYKVLHGLNSIQKRPLFCPNLQQITKAMENLFSIENVFSDKIGVNYLFIFRKIDHED